MAVNQVSMNGEELINLTNDTVSEVSLLSGETAHDASGAQITGKAQYINPNLIINSNFKINQRGISGTFTSIGAYFVDMWKLVEGSVTVNTDGTITLNGTICQVRESSINGDFLAYASAGTASYDDVIKTYTLTANGETISWAMLVYGKVKVPFVDPNEALELVKCQRYFRTISRGTHVEYAGTDGDEVRIRVPFEFPMRTTPTVFVMNHKAQLTYCYGWVPESTELTIGGCNATPYGIAYLQVAGFDLSAVGTNLSAGRNFTLATDNVFGISAEP